MSVNNGKNKTKVQFSFKQGEIPRSELQLPQLYFIAMDNWIDVIGEKAFLGWLKLYTYANREGAKDNPHLWNEATVPYSINKLAKKLGVGKDTLYNKILKPLWNVGLIDFEEYEESDAKGNKPVNVIVYKYPQNKFELSVKPLEIVRNYETDYSSDAKTYALRKRKNEVLPEEKNEEINEQLDELFKEEEGGSRTEPRVVPEQNHRWSQNRTNPGSQREHNNIFNNINNTFNDINNNLNPNLPPLKLDINEILNTIEIPKALKVRVKDLFITNVINLSEKDLLLIEDAYKHQIKKGYVKPNCSDDDPEGLNDYEFSATIEKMLKTVKNIENMRGLIQTWVQKAYDYKREEILEPVFLNVQQTIYEANEKSVPFYDWLNS